MKILSLHCRSIRVLALLLVWALCLPALSFAQTAATFVRQDTTTQGNWRGVYGSDGYNVMLESQNYPAYATVTNNNILTYVWQGSTSDVRGLQKALTPSDRIAATWYTPSTYTLDIAINDGQTHILALYALDWDGGGTRTQTIELRDTATNALLDSRNISNFSSGLWLVWNISGNVTVVLRNTGSNAVLSGIFFGPAGAPPTPLLSNGGFEAGATATGAFTNSPTDQAPWTFNGGAGVTGANSGFTSGNSGPPEGRLAAFLQGSASIVQTFNVATAGVYVASFRLVNRSFGCQQMVEVTIDGNTVSFIPLPVSPLPTVWMSAASANFNLSAGQHVIRFRSTQTGDCTAFIDDVRITAVVPTIPTTVAGSFEEWQIGYQNYLYGPGGLPWTFGSGSGILAADSAFGATGIPQGNQAAFLPGTATMTQTFTTATAGSYFLSMRVSNRAYGCHQFVRVSIDGTPVSVLVMPINPIPSVWMSAATPSFNLATGTHTVTLAGLNTGDCTAFLDDIQLRPTPSSARTVIQGSFEEWQIGLQSFHYAPGALPWTFGPGAGVVANSSAFGAPNAPQGNQAAFMQTGGHVEQSWTDSGGIYQISFSAAPRPGFSPMGLALSVNGAAINSWAVSNGAYTPFTSASFSVPAGSNTVRFTAVTGEGFLDDVRLVLISAPVVGSFNAFDASTATGSVNGSIQTKTAGTAFSLAIVALNSARTALNTSYTGSVMVQLMDARDNSGALDANGCRPTWTAISGASSNVTFASGDNGRVNATLTAADAFRDVRVRMTQGTNAGCSNDNFALRPASIVVSALDADWQTAFTGAGSPRALNNTSASGGVVHGAGRPFTLSAIGYNSAGAVTPGYDGSPTLRTGSPVCVLPSGCTTGALSFGTWSAAGSGERRATDASYSEVGTVSIELEDSGFAAVDAADTTSTLRTVPQSGGALTIGRFVPLNFELQPTGAAPLLRTMNTTDAACSVAPLGTPRRSFTYVGQSFSFAVRPTATILPRNAAGALTANYRGTLWKLTGGHIVRQLNATNTSPAGQPVVATIGGIASSDVVSNGDGTGQVTTSLLDAIRYTRNTTTPQSPFTANITTAIWISDTTEAGVIGNPATIGSVLTRACFNGGGTCAAPGSGIAFDSAAGGLPGNEFRYGRLRIANANGSELIALPAPMLTEYWSGSAWVPNTRDFCTAVTTPQVTLSNYQRNLSTGETTPTIAGPMVAGNRSIVFSAPGSGNSGSVDLTIDLSAAGANLPWLQGAWTGSTFTQNPAARATFGNFAAPSPVIFRRERY